MLIPPSYLFTNPYDLSSPAERRRRKEAIDWPALGADWSARRILGLDPALASVVGIVAGMVGYGSLMDLIL